MELLIFILQLLLATFFLGISWYRQQVMFPLFQTMSPADWPRFQQKHRGLLLALFLPILLLELALAGYTVFAPPQFYGLTEAIFQFALALTVTPLNYLLARQGQKIVELNEPAHLRLGRLLKLAWLETTCRSARWGILAVPFLLALPAD